MGEGEVMAGDRFPLVKCRPFDDRTSQEAYSFKAFLVMGIKVHFCTLIFVHWLSTILRFFYLKLSFFPRKALVLKYFYICN